MTASLESVEQDIARLQQTLEEAKQEFRNQYAGHKRQKVVAEQSSPDEVAAEALRKLQALTTAQEDEAYISARLRLKRIETQVTDDITLSTIQDLYERLQDIEQFCKSARLRDEDRDELRHRLSNCATTLHEYSIKAILARLQLQKDGSYIPLLKDTSSVADFTSTVESALKIHQLQSELPEVLDIFQALVVPFQTRFTYHFSSRRPTNRLDKPEWFLQHVLTLIEQNHAVMVQIVQPSIQKTLPSFGLLAPHEFIRALLPMVVRKVQDSSRQLLENATLIIHMIAELKQFDDTLRDDFGFCHRDQSYWSGITATYLTEDVFEAWCTAEEAFVRQRFIAITEDADAFEIIAEADVGTVEMAANPSAIKIIDLIEAMTRKFAPLESLEQRQRFKARIQSTILNDYLDKIRSSTEAFETLTSGFSGGFPTNDIAGKAGLQRLCRQLSGVSNVLSKLSDWHDDPYYIALDDDSRSEAFQAEIDEYKILKARIEGLITAHLAREFTQELKPYVRSQNWASEEVPMSSVASTNTSSSQLFNFYESVSELFSYLTSVASVVLVHRLYVAVAAEVDKFLMSGIISKAEFSRRGALQFKRDVLQIWYTFSAHVARPEAGMRGISEALIVLADGLDDQERKQLVIIDEAMALTRNEREKQKRLLKQAGIVQMQPVEVRSLLQRKLFTVEPVIEPAKSTE